jgi:hypothetical protein
MTHSEDKNASNRGEELRVGDVAQLREPHDHHAAGTCGRIIGFYIAETREALLVLEAGEKLRVPYRKLEPVA